MRPSFKSWSTASLGIQFERAEGRIGTGSLDGGHVVVEASRDIRYVDAGLAVRLFLH